MTRRRGRKNGPILDDVFGILVDLPWWGGPLLAGIAYVFLRWGFPWILESSTADNPIQLPSEVFGNASVMLASWVAMIILGMGVVAEVKKWANRRLLDTQSGAESIRDLDWQEFERLLGEAFRREGYFVEQLGGRCADGGVDLTLHRGGVTTLVQCKHWKRDRVGVKVVRELSGVVASKRADAGIVVTSGDFTTDAVAFAENAGIRLIDGDELTSLVCSVRKSPGSVERVANGVVKKPTVTVPACPKCGATMQVRTASRGPNAGSRFWGCSHYPQCRGIVNMVGD